MEEENRFRYTVAVRASEPVSLADLAQLMAKAMHPHDAAAFEQAASGLRDQLRRAVEGGELNTRKAQHAADTQEDPVDDAAVDVADLRPFLASRGIGLHVTPHGRGPEYWTIRNAVAEIATQQNLASGWWESFKQGFLDDVAAGALPAREPVTLARAQGTNVLDCCELITPNDVNRLLRSRDVPFLWHPSVASERPVVPAVGARLQSLGTQEAPTAAAPAASARIRNSTRGTRRDALSPVIEAAQSRCRNPWDAAEVWAKLLVMAERKDEPLIGCTEEGIQYLKNGHAASLSRNAFNKRIRRGEVSAGR